LEEGRCVIERLPCETGRVIALSGGTFSGRSKIAAFPRKRGGACNPLHLRVFVRSRLRGYVAISRRIESPESGLTANPGIPNNG